MMKLAIYYVNITRDKILSLGFSLPNHCRLSDYFNSNNRIIISSLCYAIEPLEILPISKRKQYIDKAGAYTRAIYDIYEFSIALYFVALYDGDLLLDFTIPTAKMDKSTLSPEALKILK